MLFVTFSLQEKGTEKESYFFLKEKVPKRTNAKLRFAPDRPTKKAVLFLSCVIYCSHGSPVLSGLSV